MRQQDGLQVKVLAAKPNCLSLTPGTHMMEGEKLLPQVVFRHPLMWHLCTPMPHIIKEKKKVYLKYNWLRLILLIKIEPALVWLEHHLQMLVYYQ